MSKMFFSAVLFFAIRVSCFNQSGNSDPSATIQKSAGAQPLPKAELSSVLQHLQKSNQTPDYNQHLYRPAHLSHLVSSVAAHPSVMHPRPFLPTSLIQQPAPTFDQQSLSVDPNLQFAQPSHLSQAIHQQNPPHPQTVYSLPISLQSINDPHYYSAANQPAHQSPTLLKVSSSQTPPFPPTVWIQQPTHAFDRQSLSVYPNLQFLQPSHLSQAIHQQYPPHPQTVYPLPLSLQPINDPNYHSGGNQPVHPSPTLQKVTPSQTPPFPPTVWMQQPTHTFDQQSLSVHPNLQFAQPSYVSQGILKQYYHHPQVVHLLPLSLQSVNYPHYYSGENQPTHPAPTEQNISHSSHEVNQTLQPSQISHQIVYLSDGRYQLSHPSKVMTYFLYPSQSHYHSPTSNLMVPSLIGGQRPEYVTLQIPGGSRNNQLFKLSEPEISKTQAILNDSAVRDSLPSATTDQGLNFPVTVQDGKPQLSRPASVEPRNQTPVADSNVISVASLRLNASDSAKHSVGASSTGSRLLSLIGSSQSSSGGIANHTVEASSTWSRQSSHLGSNLLSLVGSNLSSSTGTRQSSSTGSSHSLSSGGTAKPTVDASSAGSRQSSHLRSNLLSLLRSSQLSSAGLSQSHSLAGVFLDPQIHGAARQLAREMGLVQYYEAHGCVDPPLHLPPGANKMGLALACSAPQSQLLCQAVGQNSDPTTTNMWTSPSINRLFEFCLSQSTIRRLLTGVMQTDRVAMDPAMTMMMTSAVVGEGDPVLQTIVMMHALTGNGTANSGAGGNKNVSAGGATTVPRAASAPVGRLDQGAQQTGDLISRCKDVMLMLMMSTDATLLDAIADIRRQLMSYQCQEMTAGSGLTFRMCCPGHVHSPTYVDLAVTSMV